MEIVGCVGRGGGGCRWWVEIYGCVRGGGMLADGVVITLGEDIWVVGE